MLLLQWIAWDGEVRRFAEVELEIARLILRHAMLCKTKVQVLDERRPGLWHPDTQELEQGQKLPGRSQSPARPCTERLKANIREEAACAHQCGQIFCLEEVHDMSLYIEVDGG